MKYAKAVRSHEQFMSTHGRKWIAQTFYDLFLNLSDGFNYSYKSYKDKLLLIRDIGE